MTKYYILAVIGAFFLAINNWIFWPLLPVALAAATEISARKTYILALTIGLLTDLLTGRQLGLSALFLLISSALIYLYRSRGRVPILMLGVLILVLSIIERFLWG